MVGVHKLVIVRGEIIARNSVVGTEQALGGADAEQAFGQIDFLESIGRAAAGRHVGVPIS